MHAHAEARADDETVLEKRVDFSRVNILMLWKQTANDLLSLGAKAYFPTFNDKADIIHMGTRSIQLTLLKNALLMGVSFSYGAELVAVRDGVALILLGCSWWRALYRPATARSTAGTCAGERSKKCAADHARRSATRLLGSVPRVGRAGGRRVHGSY